MEKFSKWSRAVSMSRDREMRYKERRFGNLLRRKKHLTWDESDRIRMRETTVFCMSIVRVITAVFILSS